MSFADFLAFEPAYALKIHLLASFSTIDQMTDLQTFENF